jgi:hypothetical protein
MEQIYLKKIVWINSCILKTILFLFTSIIPVKSISQEINELKSNEVLFVYFENSDKLNFVKESFDSSKKIKTSHYNYYFENKSKCSNCDKDSFHFWLRYSNYNDLDDMFADKKTLLFKVNKSFLKKNKAIIITNKFIHEKGYEQIFKLFSKAKTIFLIDKEEISSNRITIKQVKFSFSAEE